MNRRTVNEHCLRQESTKMACGIDDLLSFTEGGKHDYDWLLTPPRTPDFPSPKGESQPTLVPPRSSLGRLTPNTNISRVSASHNQSRPATRSSSVTRPTFSSSQHSTYSSNRSSSIINSMPPSPITRSPSAIRSSTPSRPSATPSRAPSSSEKSRSSTPTRRPVNSHPPSPRSPSRPSTPTRRHSLPPASPTTASLSTGPLNGRYSRPQLLVPLDFPLETPPNLRTTLPHRPVSAGRSRPGAISSTLKLNSDTQASVTTTMLRTPSSPVVSKGRFSAYTGKSQNHGYPNGDGRVPHAPEAIARKCVVKASTSATDNNGFGRNISKKSLDMAIKHMDTRNSSGTTARSLPSPARFPQSIRTSTPISKTTLQPTGGLSSQASVGNGINWTLQSRSNRMSGRGREKDERQHFAKLSEVDMYKSSHYDGPLLKEDWSNTNRLHSAYEKSHQGPIFDKGFDIF